MKWGCPMFLTLLCILRAHMCLHRVDGVLWVCWSIKCLFIMQDLTRRKRKEAVTQLWIVREPGALFTARCKCNTDVSVLYCEVSSPLSSHPLSCFLIRKSLYGSDWHTTCTASSPPALLVCFQLLLLTSHLHITSVFLNVFLCYSLFLISRLLWKM